VTDPFDLNGPAVVSFSGGRTSAYMLRRILDAGGGERDDVHILFCNTGKEHAATLDFVHEVETRWGAAVIWLEYFRRYLPAYKSDRVREIAARAREASGRIATPKPKGTKELGYRVVDYTSASRDGEPFRNLIDMSGLPNPRTRLCTTELKIRLIKKWMLAQGYKAWDMVLGIRADEPRRVSKLRASPPERWEHEMPLADANVTEADVMAFWREQPFDLGLQHHPELGTYYGNCDLCMLKSTTKLQRIALEEPRRLDWWIRAERDTGSEMRRQRLRYEDLLTCQPTTLDELGDCFCHD